MTTEFCKKCKNELTWIDCYNCEEGYSHHGCGEDVCVCLNKEPNIPCDVCEGEGGWFGCEMCKEDD